MLQKEIYKHHRILTALSRKHPNRYVALSGNKVLAFGTSQLDAFKKAEKKIKNKKEIIGLFYLPGKKRNLYLLVNR